MISISLYLPNTFQIDDRSDEQSRCRTRTQASAMNDMLPLLKTPKTPYDAPSGSWTLIVLPDTQYYSESYPEVFFRQIEWIVAHKDSHDIRFVVHEGDIVNRNCHEQWIIAQQAMRLLNQAGIPYAISLGNHDIGDPTAKSSASNRATLFNDYFQADDYRYSHACGFFESGKLENSWQIFFSPTVPYLVIALEFGPRDAVLEWASRVVSQHPDAQVIVLSHAYLYSDSTRYNWSLHEQNQKWNPKQYGIATHDIVNDGEDIWKKLIAKHPTMEFVLSGHVGFSGTGYLSSIGNKAQAVKQIMANYQCNPAKPGPVGGNVEPFWPYGGAGWMRLMQFLPDDQTVSVRTYSPWLDRWLVQPNQEFHIQRHP